MDGFKKCRKIFIRYARRSGRVLDADTFRRRQREIGEKSENIKKINKCKITQDLKRLNVVVIVVFHCLYLRNKCLQDDEH